MSSPTHQGEKRINSQYQKPLILSSKFYFFWMIALCGWMCFGVHEEEKIVLPSDLNFSIYKPLRFRDVDRELISFGFKRLDMAKQLENSLIKIEGFPFFDKPIKVSLADKQRLADMLEDPALYRVHYNTHYPTRSRCDFRPDVAVVWKDHSIIICFGCGEIWHYHNGKFTEYRLIKKYSRLLGTFFGPFTFYCPEDMVMKQGSTENSVYCYRPKLSKYFNGEPCWPLHKHKADVNGLIDKCVHTEGRPTKDRYKLRCDYINVFKGLTKGKIIHLEGNDLCVLSEFKSNEYFCEPGWSMRRLTSDPNHLHIVQCWRSSPDGNVETRSFKSRPNP